MRMLRLPTVVGTVSRKRGSDNMRTKFHGTSGRIASICHSFGDSRGGHRNRDESTMGRDHERVNRFIAFTALLLYTILNA